MMNFVTKLSGFVGKNLTWLVLLTIVGGYFVPSGFTWAVKNTVWLLGVVMFGMGMTLHASDFKLVLQRNSYSSVPAKSSPARSAITPLCPLSPMPWSWYSA